MRQTGRIKRVTGRKAAGGERGLPAIDELELDHGDRVIEARMPTSQTGPERIARIVTPIGPGRFNLCPICFSENPSTREHVPPKPLGGTVMTLTCASCNNGLGSRVESALQDWFDHAARIYYIGESSRRPFGHGRVYLRKTPSGEFIFWPEKVAPPSDPLGAEFAEHGRVLMTVESPHPAQYKTALLKNAYLAAVLHLGYAPHTDDFVAARAELIAARDARRRHDVQMGEMAAKVTAYRTGRPAHGPELALAQEGEGASSRFLISLAGTLLVPWPFDEVDPMSSPRMRANFAGRAAS